MDSVEEKPDFLASQACTSRKYCGQCRNKDKGRKYREGWAARFKVPGDVVDFECPHFPWGHSPPKPEPKFATVGLTPEQVETEIRTERSAICDACQYVDKRGGIAVNCSKHGKLDTFIPPIENRCEMGYWDQIPLNPPSVRHHPVAPLAERIILENFQSPGDILMMTAAVRDLKKAHKDRFEVYVRTSVPDLWANSPHCKDVKHLKDEKTARKIRCEYPLVHQSNQRPYHFIHGFRKHLENTLGVDIPITEFKGDVHLTSEEKAEPCQLIQNGHKGRFWIMMAGGKADFTCKWWNPDFYQAVVDHFKGRITFAQCGEQGHWHPPLNNVINMVGKTNCRELMKLMYHADGVICPVTFAMHLAAAIPTKSGQPKIRPAVVIAGGREPDHWEKYTGHAFLSNVGRLTCCAGGGCWKSRCQQVGDGDKKDSEGTCEQPVQINANLRIPKCMHMITPARVIEAIEEWYVGGSLQYGS